MLIEKNDLGMGWEDQITIQPRSHRVEHLQLQKSRVRVLYSWMQECALPSFIFCSFGDISRCCCHPEVGSVIPLNDKFVHLGVWELETFDLPAAHLQVIFTGTTRSLRYIENDTAERQGKSSLSIWPRYRPNNAYRIYVYRSPNSITENWALALSWNKNLNLTTGIILGLCRKSWRVYLHSSKD
jgi:hypothetical protein